MPKHSTTVRNLAAGAAVAAVLSGCAGGISTVTSVNQNPADFFHYRAAASDGTVHVAVAGEAEGLSGERLNSLVAEQFSAVNVHGPKVTFSSDPETMDFGGTRFVVAFNPGPDLSVYKLCRTKTADLQGMTVAGGGAGLDAIAGFCNGNQLRHWAKSNGSPEVALEAFALRLARDVIPKKIDGKECDSANC